MRRVCAVALILLCGAGLGACGSGGNPVISSADFVATCINKVQANPTAASSVNASDYCQCYQQKLESIGLGSQTLGQASHDPQAAAAVSVCGAGLLGGSTPATTT